MVSDMQKMERMSDDPQWKKVTRTIEMKLFDARQSKNTPRRKNAKIRRFLNF